MRRVSLTEKLKLYRIVAVIWPRVLAQWRRFIRGEAVDEPPKPPQHNYNQRKR